MAKGLQGADQTSRDSESTGGEGGRRNGVFKDNFHVSDGSIRNGKKGS